MKEIAIKGLYEDRKGFEKVKELIPVFDPDILGRPKQVQPPKDTDMHIIIIQNAFDISCKQ